MEEKSTCERCGTQPRFWLHFCRPTFAWIDKQLEPEVNAEIARLEKEFAETGKITPRL
jgi:hypothetical protein